MKLTKSTAIEYKLKLEKIADELYQHSYYLDVMQDASEVYDNIKHSIALLDNMIEKLPEVS